MFFQFLYDMYFKPKNFLLMFNYVGNNVITVMVFAI